VPKRLTYHDDTNRIECPRERTAEVQGRLTQRNIPSTAQPRTGSGKQIIDEIVVAPHDDDERAAIREVLGNYGAADLPPWYVSLEP
jgi:hypothetical protein